MRNYLNLPSRKPRTRKDMVEFLKNHEGYDTSVWRSGESVYFSHNVKITHLNHLTHEEKQACYMALEVPYEFTGIQTGIDEFELDHPGYSIHFEGRSSGHIVLDHKQGHGRYPSRTEDYSDRELSEIRQTFNLVWDFDRTCQEAIDQFVYFATDWASEQELA
jgi:hypothetical protein